MANSKNSSFKYHAFISYRHADNKTQGRKWATWLHQAIETYEVPNDLVGQKNSRGDTIPPRIYPVFRDDACFGLNRSPISVLSDHRFRD